MLPKDVRKDEGGEGALGVFLATRFLLVASAVALLEVPLQSLALRVVLPAALEGITSKGLSRPVELSLSLLLLALGMGLIIAPVVLGTMAFVRLVERRVADERDARERELAEAYAKRSLLVTDMAHDLRTPVMGILSLSQALEDGLVGDADTKRRYFSSIRAKAERLGRLTDALFDFTRLESSGFRLRLEPCDLPQLVLREVAEAYGDAEDAGMRLVVDVPEEPLLVRADATQLGRVVANLILNALRHNPRGSELRVALVRRAGVAEVVVADTGVPIDGPAERLFEPFVRADAARSGEGSGLGLSIARHIADLHGFGLRLEQPYGYLTKAFILTCPILD